MSAAQHLVLALRRERLLERIAAQRGQLAAHGAQLEQPLALADKALRGVQFVKERPWIAGAGVLATVVLGRHHLLRWVGRGWALWRTWRVARQWLHENGYLNSQ